MTVSAAEFRVLIVEDDPMVGIVNRRFCEQLTGFHVVGVARTAPEAERLLAETSPHLVLLDVFMPNGSGLRLLEQIRRTDAAVDVIMLTAADDPPTIARAMRLGAVDYLIKPYDFDRFAEALQRYSRFHALLHGGDPVGQGALDRLRMDELGGRGRDGAPNGLDPLTLDSFVQYLGRMEAPQQVEEIAPALGISQVEALRYLRCLVERGDVTIDLQSGPDGRPRRLYCRR